jgi:PAS domain S-box-containing protein
VARLREVNTALGESQRAEQAARESEERFRTLAETASDAIITIDEDSITFVNPATEQVFGYSSQDLMGAGLPMLMPEYLRHLHEAGFGLCSHRCQAPFLAGNRVARPAPQWPRDSA